MSNLQGFGQQILVDKNLCVSIVIYTSKTSPSKFILQVIMSRHPSAFYLDLMAKLGSAHIDLLYLHFWR